MSAFIRNKLITIIKKISLCSLVLFLFSGDTLFESHRIHSCAVSKYPAQVHGDLLKDAERTRVIAFGDIHYYSEDNEYVIGLLKELRRCAFTHLAVELDVIHQKNINLYMKGKIDDNTLRERIPDLWIYCGTQMINAARNYNMKVICIDDRSICMSDRNKFPERDVRQYRNIKKILDERSTHKIIVFIGGYHILKEGIFNKDYNITVYSPLGKLLREKTTYYCVYIDLLIDSETFPECYDQRVVIPGVRKKIILKA